LHIWIVEDTMPTIKHILFPFDFSQQALRAAPFIQALANRFEARVTLFGVIPPVWDVAPMGMPVMAGIDLEAIERDLECRLGRVLTKELAGTSVERVAAFGDPALKIVEFAHNHAVGVIMMPTHGCGLFRSLLIGSVTAKVLHDARCPVWTATHAEEQRSPEVPRTILCAVDGSDRSAAQMKWAVEFGQKMGAHVKLLHVVPPISDWLGLETERELQEQVREEARAKIEALRQLAFIDIPLRVAVGQVATTVTEEARQEGADLVVIGRGLLQSPLGRLRTHAYGIIQGSPCPVVSV
jgi:nucleotide-binding universal stress UspA family protein